MRTHLSLLAAIALSVTALSGAQASQQTHHQKTHAKAHAGHKQKGTISYYHPKLAGKKMANGEAFHPESNAAASKELPLGTKAKVTNLENGKSETVEVKDRGPAVPGRVMDVSPATADKLDMKKDGTVPAEITPLTGPAAAPDATPDAAH
jgi:rare lipoprotein A